jgi:Zn-dependent M28 family amino/carboxypeptidase
MNIIELFEWDKYAIVDPETQETLACFAARDDGESVSMAQTSSTFTVPVVTVGKDDFEAIKRMEQSGEEIRARLSVGTKFNPETRSKNIIAKLPGKESEKGIVLCAHYDSQYNTVGAYDNASSVGLILEIASQLRNRSFRRPIYFISFGAEEYLWVGAAAHVNSLRENKQLGRYFANVNIDAILIPDQRDSLLGGSVVHHTDDFLELDQRVRRIIKEEEVPDFYNITYEAPPSPSSDHAPFVREGIPAVKLFDAAPYWFHSPDDTFEKIDFQSWDYSRRCAQRLVEELADLSD